MQVPLQIKFRHMEPSAIIEARIREQCHKLQRFANYITSCRITIEAQPRLQHERGIYRVIIDLSLPGEEIVTSQHQDQNHIHENVNVAVQDAFEMARRQLETYAKRQRVYKTAGLNSVEPKSLNSGSIS